MTRVAVVGAGWSGLACALTLQIQGAGVTVLDAAPQPGGRARRLQIPLGDRTYALDNGQHLLIGAYRESFALMMKIGVDVERHFLRMPFAIQSTDGFRIKAARLAEPWHLGVALLTARGFSLADRLSILRDVQRWRCLAWRAPNDQDAGSLFVHATESVRHRFWRPLCLAALNVPFESASARIMLNVLRDSLGGAAADSDLVLARTDLSSVFPDAAVRALQAEGAAVMLRAPVDALNPAADGGWTLMSRGSTVHADAVVLALPPPRAAALLESTGLAALDPAVRQLQAIAMAPIATVSLRYAGAVGLPSACLVLRDDPRQRRFGQWAFDRGRLDPDMLGIVTVVISGAGPQEGLTRAEIGACVARQLTDELGLPAPLAHYATNERHATIVPCPGLRRPQTRLPSAGLFLAGDSADSPYPSTLEGSVRSGIEAARAALTA
jgi:hydroxysqualene dehydroxylase